MKRKKVLITGAGSGLGKEAAISLARRGHRIYATVYYPSQMDPLIEISQKENLNMEVFLLDVQNPQDVQKVLQYDIDVLILNSAIGDSGSLAEIDLERIRQVFDTNLFGNFSVLQTALKPMIEQKKKGRIIFLSSLAGRIPMPFLSPYCASKAAIEIFATCLRWEVSYLPDAKIEIGIIEPGAYATGFNKENNEKKYTWMKSNSYFSSVVYKIQKRELRVWNFLEQKPYHSIIQKYIKAVETKHLKPRYSAPWWQAFFIQLGRIFGM